MNKIKKAKEIKQNYNSGDIYETFGKRFEGFVDLDNDEELGKFLKNQWGTVYSWIRECCLQDQTNYFNVHRDHSNQTNSEPNKED